MENRFKFYNTLTRNIDTVINLNDRICQFRIVEKQPDLKFEEVDHLDGENRGGFGNTGTN